MRRSVSTFVVVLIAVLLAATPNPSRAALPMSPALPVQVADTANGCLACHATEREAAVEGVHAQQGVTCVNCHGGDPGARELPAGHSGRFVGAPDKEETATLCGSCHSNPGLMRQYGLPTGQLAEFRASRHGQLLLGQHDGAAPTCTDCHGTHIIYPPYDARSRVYPPNIPGTCAECHANAELMAPYRLPTDQFEAFRESAHGVALFQRQNFAAPTCVNCHGAHSELPPSVDEIANVCGQCHVLVEQQFAAGPHATATEAGDLRGCIGCHSNHGTERVPVDSTSATCDGCHASDSRLHQMGVDLQRSMEQARADMESAQRALQELAGAGHRVDDYQFRYQSALTYYLQIAQKQHRLDLDTLEYLDGRVRSISVELGARAEASRESLFEHRLLLLPVWFLSLSAVALAWLALRALKPSGTDTESQETR
jgi:hypothetical protein